MTEAPAPEFSRPFRLEHLGNAAVTERLSATPAERAALARRFGLISLDRLEAELTVAWRAAGTLLEVSGRLWAAAVQRCVVTLEPLPVQLDEAVALRFASAGARPSPHAPPDEEPEEAFDPDAPDPLPPEGLDLGEEVAQALSLALDPYPRAPGASLPEAAGDGADHPFAKLRALKEPPGEGR